MMDGFKDRIGTMINRGTQHLNVESSIYYYEDDNSLYPIVDMMPKNLLTSKTLVLLKALLFWSYGPLFHVLY